MSSNSGSVGQEKSALNTNIMTILNEESPEVIPPFDQENSIKFLFFGFLKGGIRQIKRVAGWIRYRIIRRTTRIVPNRIVFMTFSNTYACNPKYIAEALIDSGEDYDLVWITSKPRSRFPWPYRIKVVESGTVEALKMASSAKLWIDNGILFSSFFP